MTTRGWLILAFSTALVGVAAGLVRDRVRVPDYIPSGSAGPRSGRELVMVYIGAEGCSWSNRPDVIAAVRSAKLHFSREAARKGSPFTALGIARDWDTDRASTHLQKFGRFDEVSLGNNWMNAMLQRYMWRDIPGPASTPQLLILERDFSDAPESKDRLQVTAERLILRKVGAFEIAEWASAGFPARRHVP